MTRAPAAPPAPSQLAELVARRPLVVALALAGALALGLPIVCPVRYQANDDAMTNLIAAGRMFSDTPDEHLLVNHVWVGLALKWLYGGAPWFPWYGSYLYLATAASLAGVCYAGLRHNPTVRQLGLVVVFLLAVGLPSLAALHFTKAAALAGLAGLLLLYSAAVGPAPPWPLWAAALAFLLLACLLRFAALLLVGAALAPALLLGLFWAPPERRWLLAAFFAAGPLLGLGLDRANRWYYDQDEGWREFNESAAHLGRFLDYHRVWLDEDTRPVMEEVGWSDIDLFMLLHWNFCNRELYSPDKLRRVADAAGPFCKDEGRRSHLWKLATAPKSLAILVGLAVCLLMGEGWRRWYVVCAIVASAVSLVVVLCQFFYVPEHVADALLATVLAAAVVASGPNGLGPAMPSWVAVGAFVMGLVSLVGFAVYFLVEAWGEYGRHLAVKEAVRRLRPRPDQLYVIWRYSTIYNDLVYPLEPMACPQEFKAASLTAICRTPLHTRRMEEFGIEGDLNLALCRRKDVFLFNDEFRNTLLADYLRQHYGVRLGHRVEFYDPSMGDIRLYAFVDLRTMKPPEKGRPRVGLPARK